jgi:hypothetical protein
MGVGWGENLWQLSIPALILELLSFGYKLLHFQVMVSVYT